MDGRISPNSKRGSRNPWTAETVKFYKAETGIHGRFLKRKRRSMDDPNRSSFLKENAEIHGRPNQSELKKGKQGSMDGRIGPVFKRGMQGSMDD